MKRLIAALLLMTVMLGLCACNAKQEPKFCGSWNDDFGNTVLILNENGTATFSTGETFNWYAADFDQIIFENQKQTSISLNTATVATEATEAEEATEATEAAETTEETAEATEAVEETTAETVEATEAAEETTAETDETAEATEAQETTAATEAATQPANNDTKVPAATGKMIIKGGYMYLSIVFEETGVKYMLVKAA